MSAPETSVERVTEKIRQLILDGTYKPGDKLSQIELAQRLGVSRTPVREAIRQLQKDELVELYPNRGAIVVRMTADELLQHLEMRAQLEAWLMRLAIPIISEADLKRAEALVEEMNHCSDERWEELNRQFHRTLYRAARRPVIENTVSSLSIKTYRPLKELFHRTRNRKRSGREHLEIIKLIRKRDTDAAAYYIETHIMRNIQELVDRVRAQESCSNDD